MMNRESMTKTFSRRILALLLAVFVFASLLLAGCDDGKDPKATADQATADSADLVTNVAVFDIDLGFVTLKYPEKWTEHLQLEGEEKHAAGDSFTLKFSAEKEMVFELLFNSEKGDLLGTIPGEKSTTLSLTVNDKSTVAEADGMKEDINVLLYYLKKDYGFTDGVADSGDSDEVFEIKSDVVSLYYPKKWQDKVTVTVEPKKVSFAQGNVPLFELCFEEADGYLLGSYNETPIYIVDHPTKTDDQGKMLEDINVIIRHLSEDEHFKIAE